MAEPSLGVAGRDLARRVRQFGVEFGEAARAHGAQPCLELGPGGLDWVEIGAVRRPATIGDASRLERRAHGLSLVRRKIVHDGQAPGPREQRGQEHPLDEGEKRDGPSRKSLKTWVVGQF